jgi:hypothetical protein
MARPRTSTRRARLPEQRDRRGPEIAVVLRRGEAAEGTLVAGARVARHLAIPLDIVLLDVAAGDRCSALVLMDEAVHLARESAPDLVVRVHDEVADVPAWLAEHRASLVAVLASPSTRDRILAETCTEGLADVVRTP